MGDLSWTSILITEPGTAVPGKSLKNMVGSEGLEPPTSCL